MPQCTFCGKTEGDTTGSSEPGPRVYVCQECAGQANKVVEEQLGEQPPEG